MGSKSPLLVDPNESVPHTLHIYVNGRYLGRCYFKYKGRKSMKVYFCDKWIWLPYSQFTLVSDVLTLQYWFWKKYMEGLFTTAIRRDKYEPEVDRDVRVPFRRAE